MKKFLIFTVITFSFLQGRAQNNALNFDGSNDDVMLPYSNALNFSLSSQFTIEGWFRTLSGGTVISNIIDQSPFLGTEIGIYNSKLFFGITNTAVTNHLRIETIVAYNDGLWHHFACVYRGMPNPASVDIYVDGIVQTQNVTNNTLTNSFSSPTAYHIGSRNNTAYFMNGDIDELRIWGKALCVAEVTSRKNCQLTGNEPDLLAYYNFNQGIASGNNTSVTSLPDLSGNGLTGTLTAFALNGQTSNWVASTSSLTGSCAPYSPVSISGNTVICTGTSAQLTANGASSYTWSNSANTLSISVSPTVNTTYTVTGDGGTTGCSGSASLVLVVSKCTSFETQFLSGDQVTVSPNPSNGVYTVNGLRKGERFVLYNVMGTVVYSNSAEEETVQVDISALSSGIYILNCTRADERVTRRLVKE